MSDTQFKDKAERHQPKTYDSVREAATAYREQLIAAAPEPQRSLQTETHRNRSAMRPR